MLTDTLTDCWKWLWADNLLLTSPAREEGANLSSCANHFAIVSQDCTAWINLSSDCSKLVRVCADVSQDGVSASQGRSAWLSVSSNCANLCQMIDPADTMVGPHKKASIGELDLHWTLLQLPQDIPQVYSRLHMIERSLLRDTVKPASILAAADLSAPAFEQSTAAAVHELSAASAMLSANLIARQPPPSSAPPPQPPMPPPLSYVFAINPSQHGYRGTLYRSQHPRNYCTDRRSDTQSEPDKQIHPDSSKDIPCENILTSLTSDTEHSAFSKSRGPKSEVGRRDHTVGTSGQDTRTRDQGTRTRGESLETRTTYRASGSRWSTAIPPPIVLLGAAPKPGITASPSPTGTNHQHSGAHDEPVAESGIVAPDLMVALAGPLSPFVSFMEHETAIGARDRTTAAAHEQLSEPYLNRIMERNPFVSLASACRNSVPELQTESNSVPELRATASCIHQSASYDLYHPLLDPITWNLITDRLVTQQRRFTQILREGLYGLFGGHAANRRAMQPPLLYPKERTMQPPGKPHESSQNLRDPSMAAHAGRKGNAGGKGDAKQKKAMQPPAVAAAYIGNRANVVGWCDAKGVTTGHPTKDRYMAVGRRMLEYAAHEHVEQSSTARGLDEQSAAELQAAYESTTVREQSATSNEQSTVAFGFIISYSKDVLRDQDLCKGAIKVQPAMSGDKDRESPSYPSTERNLSAGSELVDVKLRAESNAMDAKLRPDANAMDTKLRDESAAMDAELRLGSEDLDVELRVGSRERDRDK